MKIKLLFISIWNTHGMWYKRLLPHRAIFGALAHFSLFLFYSLLISHSLGYIRSTCFAPRGVSLTAASDLYIFYFSTTCVYKCVCVCVCIVLYQRLLFIVFVYTILSVYIKSNYMNQK